LSAGQLWGLPGGHRAIETDGSTRDRLNLLRLEPGNPGWRPATLVPANLCTPLPMKYHGGQTPTTQETTRDV
jgi:hypothetical protein